MADCHTPILFYFNPSAGVPAYLSGIHPSRQRERAGRIPVACCRLASPTPIADTWFLPPDSPLQWYRWRSCCRRKISIPRKRYPC